MGLSDQEIRCAADHELWVQARQVRKNKKLQLKMRVAAFLIEVVFYFRSRLGLCGKPPKWFKFKVWKACGPNVHATKQADPFDPLNHACIIHDFEYKKTD
jgi:hypothetical protein